MMSIFAILIIVVIVVQLLRRVQTKVESVQNDATRRKLNASHAERVKAAKLIAGGSADRPIRVTSPAVIETKAASEPCVLCGNAVQIDEHEARTVNGMRRRVVHVSCRQCGHPRKLYFEIEENRLN